MPILRAGPFASSSDSFLDEPDPADVSIVPVNCAKDTTSANWEWKHFKESLNVPAQYANAFPDLSDSETFNSTGEIIARAAFAYQAVSDFDVDLTYSLSASTSGGFFDKSSVEIDVTLDNSSIFSVNDEDEDTDGTGRVTSASISGTVTLTLKASVVPLIVRITLIASVGSLADGNDVSISVSLS